MKLSCATLLLTISSANAFSVSYLNQLSTSAAAPSGSGMTGYLDGISGAGAPELVTAMAPAPVAAPPAPVAAAPVAAAPVASSGPSANIGAGRAHLDTLAGSSAPTGAGLVGHLDSLAGGASAPSGAGLTGYLDALPATATAPTGAGLTGHLDSLGGGVAAAAYTPPAPAAPAAASPVAAAAPAAPVAAAPVASSGPSANIGAGRAHLDTLGGSSAPTGAGLTGHLDSLTVGPGTTGAGLVGHLDSLASNAAGTSGAGLTGYLDALATNSAIAGPTGGSSVTSFLETVYSQIMSLPEDSRTVSGNSVAFASADGPYAMSFVKN